MNPDVSVQELDDWQLVCQLLPAGWQEQASLLGALRRARGFANAAVLLRTLLVHLAGGCSLKETATNAQQAGWCDVSPVALFKRLRAAEQWLRWMANELWQRTSPPPLPHGYRVRGVDATTVGRPGCRGTDWRVHFSVNLANLQCDFLQVTDAHGGETFRRIPVAHGDLLLGDRCYGTPPGIAHVANAGGHVLVRVNHKALPLFDIDGRPFRLVEELGLLRVAEVRQWVAVVHSDSRECQGRLVAVKRDRWATAWEQQALCKRASKKHKKPSQTALFLAGYFFAWTDVPAQTLDMETVLAWYRCRWQVELCFKRMKSILGLGDLPKRRDDSCRAWLHGKLLVALLLERLLDNAEHFSPWGYELATATQSLA
jgi:hypothetical protein